MSYHHWTIDKQLGLLIDNGDLHSRLYKLYLHALTSHCLPDPLTSRTGTEEALHGLRMASTQSFSSLDMQHIEQIRAFAKLAPARDYFPQGSKFMQTIHWENLSPLSQHESFVTEARRILAQAESSLVFQPGSNEKLKLSLRNSGRGADDLRQRAAVMNAFHRVIPFGGEYFSSAVDTPYHDARDLVSPSPRESEACLVATMVDEWTSTLR